MLVWKQCLTQLSYFETHNSLENVRKLRDIALVCTLGNIEIPLLQDVTDNIRLLKLVCMNQLQFAPTLSGEDFIHIVGTVDGEPTHICIQESAGFRYVDTLTVHTVEAHHEVG